MIANGTIKTVVNEEGDDIFISLSELCLYFTQSALAMEQEIQSIDPKAADYARGLSDMMYTLAKEMNSLGKFEAQRRMINSPEDLFKMIDKDKKE